MSKNLEAPNAYAYMARELVSDAAEYGVRFHGSQKVYLGSIPGLDLGDAECVAMLDALRTSGLVEFARCDLTAAADADLLEQSEYMPAGTPALFHFLRLPA